jgi:hypothetical protein
MTKRFISLAMAIVTLDVYLRSQLYPKDPLFFFISNNFAVNVGMIIVAVLVLLVSFKKSFRHWISYAVCGFLAAALSMIGLLSLFSSGIYYWLSGIILPLNAMLVLEAGIILGICALTYEHAPRPASLKLPALSPLLPKLAFPVPKIPHSPTTAGASGRRIQPA